MKAEQELLVRMHRRAGALRRRRDRSLLRVWGGVSMGLLFSLLSLAAAFSGGHGLAGNGIYGSSLLSDSAGGYVLTGVLAFMLGVGVSVLCFRHRRKTEEQKDVTKEELP